MGLAAQCQDRSVLTAGMGLRKEILIILLLCSQSPTDMTVALRIMTLPGGGGGNKGKLYLLKTQHATVGCVP